MIVKVRRDSDPFKKYWWAILLGFGVVGMWVCLPLMDTQTGAVSVSREDGLAAADDSLDFAANPQGAPGSAINLSMEGTGAYGKKSFDGPIASSLYAAPPKAEASTATAAAAASIKPAKGKKDLASALKYVSKKKSASADPTGWGGKKAQKGFSAPKLSGGSGLSGLGGGGGGGSFSMSAAQVPSGGGGSAFGTAKAQVGFASTRGLKDDGSDAGGGSMGALKSAAGMAMKASQARSLDSAMALGGRAFDASGGQGTIGGGGPRPLCRVAGSTATSTRPRSTSRPTIPTSRTRRSRACPPSRPLPTSTRTRRCAR